VCRPVCAWLVFLMLGCAAADRSVPPPVVLPEDPATAVYTDVHPKLRQLGWRATEAFYRDDWRDLGDTAELLTRASNALKQSKSTPPRVQATLTARCDELAAESGKLLAASRTASSEAVGGHLQRIHTLIRELRPEP
jgi:hypothetical protein